MADNNPNWQVVLIRDGEIYGYMGEPNVYARHMKDVPHLVFTAEGGVKTLRRGRTNTWKANELCRELEKIISPESAAEHKKENKPYLVYGIDIKSLERMLVPNAEMFPIEVTAKINELISAVKTLNERFEEDIYHAD